MMGPAAAGSSSAQHAAASGAETRHGAQGLTSSGAIDSAPPRQSSLHESRDLDAVQKENEVLRALLRQQKEIGDLKKENEELRKAVCKIDPKSGVC